MTKQAGRIGAPPTATFHARVAGAALVTALVVLVAACLTFMLQQWAVAGAQSQISQTTVAQITASAAGEALGSHEPVDAALAIAALEKAPHVVSAKLTDVKGRVIARYTRPARHPVEGALKTVRTPVASDGIRVGDLTITDEGPALSAMAPQFIALTGALLFAGIGVALFLARGLAHKVIAPVQRLSEAMGQVAADGTFTPVPVHADDALFRSLTTSFNHLLGKLDEREKALQQTMAELMVARDAANAANVLKSQFLANMSHEIRTPLNGVLAMAEVMSIGDLPRVQRERLDVIRQSGGLLLAVLNDVLDLSKIEAGKLTLIIDDFDLENAIGSVRESFAVMAGEKGLDFSVTITEAAKGGWRGDADRLRQILGNLLSNAVKFTQSGSVKASFDLCPGGIELRISDTGMGIPVEKQLTLFEKFNQADNSATRRFGGTGLGLAICRELTQMMGGDITLESQDGLGSTFCVTLPLERGEAKMSRSPEGGVVVEETEGVLRLLAAEDNPTNQQVLAAVMESLGIDVEIVADGRAAYEAWRDGSYDLILMDIQMPVMDGMDSAKAIRALESAEGRRRTPIVALTANALSHQIQDYLAVGMDGHVAKPIEIAKLYDAIGRALTDTPQAAPDIAAEATIALGA